MNLAAGYIAQTLQTHDELDAARANEQRRMAADRRATAAERAERKARAQRDGLLGRLAALWHDGRTSSTARIAH